MEGTSDRPGPAVSGPTPTGARARAPWWAFCVLGFVLLALGLATWQPFPAGVWHDDGVYVLLGKSVAEGGGLTYGGVAGSPPATKFPPLYPAVVAAVWRVGPAFPANVAVIAGLNLVLLSLAGALFALWCVRDVGLGRWAGLTVAGVAFVSMDVWRVGAIPLSEPLFLVTLMAALLLGSGLTEARARPPTILLFLLGFAFVAHTRSIGVTVGAAAVAVTLLDRRWKTAVGLGAGCALILVPWAVWAARRADDIAGPLRDILGSYGGWFSQGLLSDPGHALLQMPAKLLSLGDWSLAMVLPGVPAELRWGLGLLVGPAMVLGLVDLTRRSRLGGGTVLLLLGALWVWPFLDRRLMTPMVPFLVLALLLGVARIGGGRVIESSWQPLAHDRGYRLGVTCAWAAWFTLSSLWGLGQGLHRADFAVRARALEGAVEAVNLTTGADAVIGAPELWAAINLYTGRTVAPSARFRPGGAAGPTWGAPEDQYALWVSAGLDHVLVEHGGQVHGPALDRMDQVCPGGAVEVRASLDGAFLVRLNWDEACRRRLLR